MPAVRLDSMLRAFAPKLSAEVAVGSVESVIVELETRFPRLRFRIRDETGELRRFVRVFVNGDDIALRKGLQTPVGPTDKVDILHSIQGG